MVLNESVSVNIQFLFSKNHLFRCSFESSLFKFMVCTFYVLLNSTSGHLTSKDKNTQEVKLGPV